MTGEIILQAVAEIVLSVPLRRNKTWRRVFWTVILVIFGIAIISTASK
jgi:uncharacterized membrane protein HdeD (DUF308 family)